MNRTPTHRVWRLACAVVVTVIVITALARPDGRSGVTAAAGHPRPPQHPAASVRGPSQVWLPLAFRSFAGVPPFGVQFYSIPAVALDLADQAGARWVRDVAEWATIEPVDTTPANYNWTALDQSVTAVTQRDIGLILTLRIAPSWAAPTPEGPLTDLADLVQFARAVVERYDSDGVSDAPGSPYVRYFELYNEPDSVSGWGYHASQYAQMLRTVYPAIHAANPDALVVFGGVALDWWVEDGGNFVRGFLDGVLAACRNRDCFDVMNFHYFPTFRPGWEQYGPDIIGKATYVRQRLAAYGFRDVPLICTETSWYSNSWWGSDELQSRYVAKVYARAMAADLDIAIWFAMMEADPGLPGLLDYDLRPKPGYTAYQTATAMLAGARYDRALTPEETGSSQLVGYTFAALGRRLDVVWTEDSTPFDIHDDPWLVYSAPATRLRIVDKFGNVSWRRDADDGTVDGQTRVTVGGSPLFLEYFP